MRHSLKPLAAHATLEVAQPVPLTTFQTMQATDIDRRQQITPGSRNASVSLFLLVCLALVG